MKATWIALLSGAVFGLGLVLSGMTDPRNVARFLDFTGDWSPNLALVMGGAITVHASVLRWSGRRECAADPSMRAAGIKAPARRVDTSLVAGAAVFGVGWGLGGYCPAPAIVALGFGSTGAAVFVFASIVGMLAANLTTASPSLDVPESAQKPASEGVAP